MHKDPNCYLARNLTREAPPWRRSATAQEVVRAATGRWKENDSCFHSHHAGGGAMPSCGCRNILAVRGRRPLVSYNEQKTFEYAHHTHMHVVYTSAGFCFHIFSIPAWSVYSWFYLCYYMHLPSACVCACDQTATSSRSFFGRLYFHCPQLNACDRAVLRRAKPFPHDEGYPS